MTTAPPARFCAPVAVGAALVALLAPGAASGQHVVRGPYIQLVTPETVIVVWRTDVPTAARVEVGSAPGVVERDVVVETLATQHEVRIDGLTPDTRYYYAVGTPTRRLAGGDTGHHLKTAPPAGTPRAFRAWIVGDSGTGDANQREVFDTMRAFTRDAPPDLYLHLGDMAYGSGTDAQFQANFFDIYASLLRTTACWPTMGNHEGSTSVATTATGPYYDAYVMPTAGEAGGVPSGTEAYYAFDWANVHFIVLESHQHDRTPGGDMLRWLEADIAATDQRWIVAYWHHPPYTKGTHDSDTEGQLVEMREHALPILEAGGVDLVLAGHSHIYERSFLVHGAYDTPTVADGFIVDPGDGDPARDGAYNRADGAAPGAVYMVAGHGGKATGRDGFAPHPLMVRTQDANGSVLLDVDGDVMTATNLRRDGIVSDVFTLTKGDPMLLVAPNGRGPLVAGDAVDIRWEAPADVLAVDVSWSRDGGARWEPIAARADNRGGLGWIVPQAATSRALVRIADADDPARMDTSDAPFRIDAVRAPNTPPTLQPFPDPDVVVGRLWVSLLLPVDPDGDRVAILAHDLPAGLFVSPGGLVQWNPAADQVGAHAIELEIRDERGATTSAMMTIRVWGDADAIPEGGGAKAARRVAAAEARQGLASAASQAADAAAAATTAPTEATPTCHAAPGHGRMTWIVAMAWLLVFRGRRRRPRRKGPWGTRPQRGGANTSPHVTPGRESRGGPSTGSHGWTPNV